ncbi:MAG TPA: hypothetical protein DCP08_01660 [Chloroflexi bacterium]|nr:hypothetical protein [Chloroflexota bacterium]
MAGEEVSGEELTALENELVGDVTANSVEMTQSGAQTIKAQEVRLHQSGAQSIEAEKVTIRQGGAQYIQGGEVSLSQGGALTVRGETIALQRSGALVVSGQEVEVKQGGAGLLVAGRIKADEVRSIFVASGPIEGSVTTVLDQKSALALGAALGASLAFIYALRSIFTGRD